MAVELTEAEAKAALDRAVQEKEAQIKAEEEAARAAAAAKKEEAEARKKAEQEAADRKANPGNYVGVVLEGLPDPVYYRNASPQNDRTIALGEGLSRVTYEHVSEDADGVWLYRHLG